jgi:pimeloyl-ACP methyl ester carboxylesterase
MMILQVVAVVLAAIMLARALNLILLMRWYAKPHAPGEVVYLNNKRVYYTAKGTQSPTIVIEAGLGSSSAEWWGIQDRLAASARVVTYDRAGYGWSELAHGPRSSKKIATELKALLESLEIRPPYVLVGHSKGGLYVNHFCRLYPDEVAGIVLLDPLSPDDMRFKQELLPRIYKRSGVNRSGFLKIQGWLSGFGFLRLMKPFLMKSHQFALYRSLSKNAFRAFWNNLLAPKTPQAAMNEYVQSHDPRNNIELKNSGDVPPVPMRVVVHNPEKMRDDLIRYGDLSREEADQVEHLWQELLRAQASLSPAGKVIQADTGSHYIHLAQPDLVVRTILEVVQEAT